MSETYDASHSHCSDESGNTGGIDNVGVDNERKRSLRQSSLKTSQRVKEDLTFLADFDPEKSKREKRKIKRHIASSKNIRSIYDEKGRYRENQLNICDCMNQACLGCFFPCPSCLSTKCGPVCRVNRKYTYESIHFDGNNDVVTNRFYLPPRK